MIVCESMRINPREPVWELSQVSWSKKQDFFGNTFPLTRHGKINRISSWLKNSLT